MEIKVSLNPWYVSVISQVFFLWFNIWTYHIQCTGILGKKKPGIFSLECEFIVGFFVCENVALFTY